ncbi:hypothetical protein [Trichlorobacter lovleyi]|uniref:hypothetical protein n=1 Tax=Trichlorobacter lovleyi TaxID=313985 RepID=UPI0023F3FFF6|nr:hypothetical protein [Trichlorobacter lovleyi]
MPLSQRKNLVLCCLMTAMLPMLTWAGNDRPPRGERRRPPQAAFDACKGKTEGASITIATPHGSFKAICRNFEGALAAVPEGAPPPPQTNGNGPTPGR